MRVTEMRATMSSAWGLASPDATSLSGVAVAVGGAAVGGLLPELMATAFAAEPARRRMRRILSADAHRAARQSRGAVSRPRTGCAMAISGRKRARSPHQVDEAYDLVVVGGGISGLAAAHFYRARVKTARILILDNHDDFGGHAKRNEFQLGGRLALINGGTFQIDSPRPYSAVADGLLRTLGTSIRSRSPRKCADRDFYPSLGLRRGVFFDQETFGADKLVVPGEAQSWAERLAGSPLSPAAQRDIARIEEAQIDYLPGLSSDEKKSRLASMSYRDFLLNVVKADAGVVAFYQARTHGEWGVGIDAVSALDVWAFDFPGFQGLGLKPGSAPHMGYTAAGYADGGSYTFHFPDGNASIARDCLCATSFRRGLPGNSAEDVVAARMDYSRLDRTQSPGPPAAGKQHGHARPQ